MKKIFTSILTLLCGCALLQGAPMQMADDEVAETRRPVDSQHPMWLRPLWRIKTDEAHKKSPTHQA